MDTPDQFVLVPYENCTNPRFDEDGDQVQFTFAELSEPAKTKARDKWRENGRHDDWWDSIYEDAVTVGKLIGIEIGVNYPLNQRTGKTSFTGEPDISFRGFCSQGDGCCYSGDLVIESLKGCVDKLKTHVGECTDGPLFKLAAEGEALHDMITARMMALRMQGVDTDDLDDNDEEVEIGLKDCVSIEGTDRYWRTATVRDGCVPEVQEAMDSYVSGFADWIYEQLEAEDEHLNSDEYIDDEITQQESIFDESGSTI